MSEQRFEIAEELQFRPRWWWDPVPPWLFQELERVQVIELARVHIELQRGILQQQLAATEASLKILGAAGKG